MGTPNEDQLDRIEDAIAVISALLGFAVEGVARTGAFDQAGTQTHVADLLEKLRVKLGELHLGGPDVILRGALERVKNDTVHIRRLSDR